MAKEKKDLEEAKEAAEETAEALGKMAAQMSEFFKVLSSASEKTKQETKSVSDQLKESAEKAAEAAGASSDYEKVLNKLNKTSGTTQKSMSGLGGSLQEALKKAQKFSFAMAALNGVLASIKSTFGVMKSMITGVFSVMKGFIGLGMKLWTGLLDAAVDYTNGSSALRQAIENVRKEFGDLSRNEGANVMKMYSELNKTSTTLASSGRSVWHTFGDFAERMQFVTEIATAAGKSITRFGDALVKNLPQLALLNKSLNVSNEGLIQMIKNAERAGKDPKESFNELAVSVAHLSKKFGVSAKMIGKNFDELIKDTDTFGHLAPKTLAATAAYAAKLNVEIATLKGLMDTFDTFEGAATAAGKLNEVLGIQVDTMKLINADNPAARMDMLRKSFEETGKSVSNLSRFELKALSDAMGGMPIEDLKNSLSMSTDDVNFAEIAEEAAEAQKNMSPVEAMNELSKNIEKLIKSGELVKGGFFANFVSGMEKGIERSKDFRGFMRYISRQLRAVTRAGREVGKILGPIFSDKGPLGKLIKQYKQLIDFSTKDTPGWTFLEKVKDAFRGLMKDLQTDPKKALVNFFKKLKTAWTDFTKKQSPIAKDLGNGFKDLFIGALEFIRDEVPKMMKSIGESVRSLTEGIGAAFKDDGAVKNIQNPFMRTISDALTSVLRSVWENLVGPVLELAKTLGGIIWKYMKPIIEKVFYFLLVKALITAMAQAVVAEVVKKMIVGAMTKLGMQVAVQNTLVNGIIIANNAQGVGVAASIMAFGAALMNPMIWVHAGLIVLFISVTLAALVAAMAALYAEATAFGLIQNAGDVAIMLGLITLFLLDVSSVIATAAAVGIEGEALATPALIGLGVVAAVAFGIGLLMIPLWAMSEYSKNLDFPRIFVTLGAITTLLTVSAALILAGSAIGAYVAGTEGIGLAVAVAGIAAVAVIAAMLPYFLTSLWDLHENSAGIDFKRVSMSIDNIAKLLTISIVIITAATAVAAFMVGTLGTGSIAIAYALTKIEEIFTMVTDKVVGVFKAINDMKIPNMEIMEKKMNMFTTVVQLISTSGKLVIDAAKIAQDTGSGWFTFSTTATENFVKIMNSMEGFMRASNEGIKNLITQIGIMIKSFVGLSPEQMEKLSVLGPIIAAIAQLASGMAKPISDVAQASLAPNVDMEGFEVKMKAIGSQMESIFKLFTGNEGLSFMVQKFIDMANKIEIKDKKQLENIKNKTQIVATTIGAVASLSEAMASLLSASKNERQVDRKEYGTFGGVNAETHVVESHFDIGPVQEVLKKVKQLLDDGMITTLINDVINQSDKINPISKGQLSLIRAGYSSLTDYINIVSQNFGNDSFQKFADAYSNAKKLHGRIDKKTGPMSVIKLLLEEGKSIMKEVAAMTGKVDASLLAQSNGAILGLAEKDGTVTLKFEKIQVNLALNIEIETKEIVYALQKGHKGGGPYYELNTRYNNDAFFNKK